MAKSAYKTVSKPGVCVAIVNGGRLLLLKRIWLPFIIVNPGVWSVVGGASKANESPLDTAYREINEEVGISNAGLKVVAKGEVIVRDVKKRIRWENPFYVMRSSSERVRLNMEHTGYRWVEVKDLEREEGIRDFFEDSDSVIKMIRSGVKNTR